MKANSKRKLAVLLASYNGSAHIREQIESIASQNEVDVYLFVSDDGSMDNTKLIVKDFINDPRLRNIDVSEGPQAGFAENFRTLISRVDETFDYYAFSDQDDVWLPDKMTRAIARIAEANTQLAAVYCGRTEIVSEKGVKIGLSPLFVRPPSFRNAVVQSIAGGNTMVLNNAAMRLLKIASARSAFIVHDWFCYLVVSGCGGLVLYDAVPSVRYRQHASNIIGSNNSFKAKITRILMLFSGRFADWNSRNVEALDKFDDLLTIEAKEVLENFKAARTGPLATRMGILRKSGIFRQTRFGTISLFVACLFKRL